MEKTLRELADYVNGEIVGDENIIIKGVMTIDEAGEGYITFVSNEKYIKKINQTKASAIIISPKIKAGGKNLLLSENPYLAFAKIFDLMMSPKTVYPGSIDDSAKISESAAIGPNATIYPFVYIGDNSKIADNVVLYPGVFIGDDCQVGRDISLLYPTRNI